MTIYMGECDSKKDDDPSAQGLGSKLLQSRTVLISAQVDQELAEKTMAQLLILDAESDKPIRVYVTSQGGHVDSGYAIHDIMRFLRSRVITIGAGWVASIAIPILFGATKENRYSLPNTRFLIHQPSGGAGGQASDIRIEAHEILKIRERINKLIATETGTPVEQVAKDSERNFWMNAEEAVKYGLVSKIVTRFDDIKT